MEKEDYYKVLGVPRNASTKEIKKSYYEVRLRFLIGLIPRHVCDSRDWSRSQTLMDLYSIHSCSLQRSTIRIGTKGTQRQPRSSPRLEKLMK